VQTKTTASVIWALLTLRDVDPPRNKLIAEKALVFQQEKVEAMRKAADPTTQLLGLIQEHFQKRLPLIPIGTSNNSSTNFLNLNLCQVKNSLLSAQDQLYD